MSTSSFEKKIARLHVMLWSLTLAIALIRRRRGYSEYLPAGRPVSID